MDALLAEARLAAQSDASVLIQGESGTGKELLARAIHRASPRHGRPFVAINCGAIPAELLESELFGHVKGAFTGAGRDHAGLFQSAEGGTVLLDEIVDRAHPAPLQVKLLRVLQEGEVRPVGATETRPVDVRILSATHRNLEEAIASGEFREDLYYRLNVVNLTLPPLRERREDIPLLAQHFLTVLTEKYQRRIHGFAPDALDMLTAADWPGNIRQLHNVLEQCCALCTTTTIPVSLVARAARQAGRDPAAGRGALDPRARLPDLAAEAHPRPGQRSGAAGRPQPHRGLPAAAAPWPHPRAVQGPRRGLSVGRRRRLP